MKVGDRLRVTQASAIPLDLRGLNVEVVAVYPESELVRVELLGREFGRAPVDFPLYKTMPMSWLHDPLGECVLCGERVWPEGDDPAIMHDPNSAEGGVCHAQCGLDRGWVIS
jgi:hypothetical protein